MINWGNIPTTLNNDWRLCLFLDDKARHHIFIVHQIPVMIMAKEKKPDNSRADHNDVKTPRPPQHIDPSSPPGKGRNKEDQRGNIDEDDRSEKREKG